MLDIHINNDMNINIHSHIDMNIDINVNIDIHIIINMNNILRVGNHFQVLQVLERTGTVLRTYLPTTLSKHRNINRQ